MEQLLQQLPPQQLDISGSHQLVEVLGVILVVLSHKLTHQPIILQFKHVLKELLLPIMTLMGMEFLTNQYLVQEQIQI